MTLTDSLRVGRFLEPVGVPTAVTAGLWVTSQHEVAAIDLLLAQVLLLIPWVSYVRWRRRSRALVPVFALIAAVYWVYYVPQLFWGSWSAPGMWAGGRMLSETSITRALAMALVGVASLWLGTRVCWGGDTNAEPNRVASGAFRYRWRYIRGLLLIGIVLALFERSPYVLGEGGRQVLVIAQTTVPTAAFALLFRRHMRGEATAADRGVLGLYAVVRILVGLATGWLGTIPLLGIAAGVVYLMERRKIPGLAVGLIVAAVVILQPAKNSMRDEFWSGQNEADKLGRVGFWVGQARDLWGGAMSGSSGAGWQDLANQTLSRTSLMTQTANVLEFTPDIVAFQGPHLYSYMLITWIPRAFWPAKPSVNESNQFYQVAYGLTAPENLSSVSIAVGSLTEGYIAFGWPGVIGVMFLLGILLGAVQRGLLGPHSSPLLAAFGVVLVLQLVVIEGQMAQYVGGMAQHLAMGVGVFLPAVRFDKKSHAPSVPAT